MKIVKATRTMTTVQLDVELREDLAYGENPQKIANLWVEEQQKWPHLEVWILGVRVLRVPRRIQPIVIESSR